jgi:hypothetical protein
VPPCAGECRLVRITGVLIFSGARTCVAFVLVAVIDLRPVYHRKEERIRAHVILCWLALLLARVAENACAATWPELRRQLDRIQVGTFNGPAGTFRQRTQISPAQAAILEQLGIDQPPKIYQLTPATSG